MVMTYIEIHLELCGAHMLIPMQTNLDCFPPNLHVDFGDEHVAPVHEGHLLSFLDTLGILGLDVDAIAEPHLLHSDSHILQNISKYRVNKRRILVSYFIYLFCRNDH